METPRSRTRSRPYGDASGGGGRSRDEGRGSIDQDDDDDDDRFAAELLDEAPVADGDRVMVMTKSVHAVADVADASRAFRANDSR